MHARILSDSSLKEKLPKTKLKKNIAKNAFIRTDKDQWFQETAKNEDDEQSIRTTEPKLKVYSF